MAHILNDLKDLVWLPLPKCLSQRSKQAWGSAWHHPGLPVTLRGERRDSTHVTEIERSNWEKPQSWACTSASVTAGAPGQCQSSKRLSEQHPVQITDILQGWGLGCVAWSWQPVRVEAEMFYSPHKWSTAHKSYCAHSIHHPRWIKAARVVITISPCAQENRQWGIGMADPTVPQAARWPCPCLGLGNQRGRR